MKKGSRKTSDNLESSSCRAFKEQLRQISITDEIKICLTLPCEEINILPAPHPRVKEGPFPSFSLMSENSVSTPVASLQL